MLQIRAYANPAVIISSVLLFLVFMKANIGSSKIINFVATSAFSAYLFHMRECIKHQFYTDVILV